MGKFGFREHFLFDWRDTQNFLGLSRILVGYMVWLCSGLKYASLGLAIIWLRTRLKCAVWVSRAISV
jgi:hypothetical protein